MEAASGLKGLVEGVGRRDAMVVCVCVCATEGVGRWTVLVKS